MKFTIRDILWLTILVALAVAWWLDHRANAARQELLIQEVEQANYKARIERVQRVIQETEIVRERALLDVHLRDAAKDLKRAMEALVKSPP